MKTNQATRRLNRGGSIYLLVLVTALVVSAIGMSALTVSRVKTASSRRSNESASAALLATGAVEYALGTLGANANWRTTYAHGTEYESHSIGGGTCSWKLVDPLDGDLGDDARETARLYGIGRTGDSTRVYSVELPTEVGMDVLKTAVASAGNINAEDTPFVSGGVLSTNGTFNVPDPAAKIYGNVEALAAVILGEVDGKVLAPAPSKTIPGSSVYELYKDSSTKIGWANIPSGSISNVLLSPATTPYGVTNVRGIYRINVPAGQTLTIENSRLHCTLVVYLNIGAKLKFLGGVYWSPAQPDLASLLVSAASSTEVCFDLLNTTFGESGANLNPASTPYNGASDNDTSDSYPTELRGVFHVIGASSDVHVQENARFVGTLLTEGSVRIEDSPVLIVDPNLVTNKPWGYTQASPPRPVAGTWVWDQP